MFKKSGADTCGIEPTNAAIEAHQSGHDVVQGYFSCETVEALLARKAKPDIVTFTNVFATLV